MDYFTSVENITAAVNGTGTETQTPITPTGMGLAIVSSIVMALMPIFFGSYRSVSFYKEKYNICYKSMYTIMKMQHEKMSKIVVILIPIVAFCILFGFYVCLEIFSIENINKFFTGYCSFMVVFVLTHVFRLHRINAEPNTYEIDIMYHNQEFKNNKQKERAEKKARKQNKMYIKHMGLQHMRRGVNKKQLRDEKYAEDLSEDEDAIRPCTSNLIPNALTNVPYRITFQKEEEKVSYGFNILHAITLIFCFGMGVWYYFEKHWIVNNIFGLATALTVVELVRLKNIINGFLLLSLLFICDICYCAVFGTGVMKTVAVGLDIPGKIVFPGDLLTNGFGAKDIDYMLGLGDIVIPGIFIALLLRFDNTLNRKSNLYFNATLIAYLFGLVTAIFYGYVSGQAQPVLLYLVPICLGVPTIIAIVKGDFTALMKYEDGQAEKPTFEDLKNAKILEIKKME